MSQSNAARQAAFRARRGFVRSITVHLTEDEANLFDRCHDRQRDAGDRTSFAKQALLTGAKFRANAGQPPKHKIR